MPRKQTKAQKQLADDAEQAHLHAAAAKFVGCISGGDPRRSKKVRETVCERLLEKLAQGRV